MDRIVIDQPMFDELVHPFLRIIVEPEAVPRIGERRMMKKRNIAETELACCIDEQEAQFGQRSASGGGFAEAVSEPPHRRLFFLRGLRTQQRKGAPRKLWAHKSDGKKYLRISEYN